MRVHDVLRLPEQEQEQKQEQQLATGHAMQLLKGWPVRLPTKVH